MTIKEVRDQLEKIQLAASQGDSETAHSLEDKLFESVVRVFASDPNHHWASHRNKIGLAKEALKSKDIQFKRACS